MPDEQAFAVAADGSIGDLRQDDVGRSCIAATSRTIRGGRSAIDVGRSAIDAGRSAIDAGRSAIDAGRSAIDAGQSAIDAGQSAIVAGRRANDAGRSVIDAGRRAIDAGRVDALDPAWWAGFRESLERAFEQDAILVRALPMQRL